MAVWSEVYLSYVLPKSRIDSDFYKPAYLKLEELFSEITNHKIKEISIEIPELFKKSYSDEIMQYNDIGSVDLVQGTIKDNRLKIHEAPGRATYINRKDDILISTVRPNRNANAIINELDVMQVSSNGFCNLRAKNIDPNYLFIFSKTKYFYEYIVRFSKSSMYPAVSVVDVLNFPIFIPKDRDVIDKISRDIKLSRELILKSQSSYTQAQLLLESALGLETLDVLNNIYYESALSSCVKERIIDSKYHNPKYSQLKNYINTRFETTELKKIANVEYGYMPMQDYEADPRKGIPLIRVTNITDQLEIKIDDLKYIPRSVKIPPKKYVEQADILVVQCGDTTGKVGYIYDEIKNHLFPSFCLSIKVTDQKINSLFLAALLKTKLMQILFDQTVMINTVRPNTTKPRLEKLIIPIFSKDFQDKIARLLLESNKAKKESQQLLEQAKRRVEELIEKAVVK
jgi:type I restriction enzyme S subunit